MSPKDYGYRSREDAPARITVVPPQATPQSQLPRKVGDAVRNPQETTATLHQILAAYSCDNTALSMIGAFTPSSTTEGGSGSETITNEYWWSEIGRYCRYVSVVSSTTDNKRINRTGIAFEISPLAVLDPAVPEAPFVWRFEDVVAARLVTPSSTHKGIAYFGQTWENATGVALASPKPFIGFSAYWTGTAYGTWYARCVDDSGSGLHYSLGVTTELPHRLCYAIDGRGQVVFSIDGEDLYSYSTTGSDLGTNTSFAIDHRWCVGADNGGTIRAGYMMDGQTLVSVEVLDEAA